MADIKRITVTEIVDNKTDGCPYWAWTSSSDPTRKPDFYNFSRPADCGNYYHQRLTDEQTGIETTKIRNPLIDKRVTETLEWLNQFDITKPKCEETIVINFENAEITAKPDLYFWKSKTLYVIDYKYRNIPDDKQKERDYRQLVLYAWAVSTDSGLTPAEVVLIDKYLDGTAEYRFNENSWKITLKDALETAKEYINTLDYRPAQKCRTCKNRATCKPLFARSIKELADAYFEDRLYWNDLAFSAEAIAIFADALKPDLGEEKYYRKDATETLNLAKEKYPEIIRTEEKEFVEKADAEAVMTPEEFSSILQKRKKKAIPICPWDN